jgi:hypothetical protein
MILRVWSILQGLFLAPLGGILGSGSCCRRRWGGRRRAQAAEDNGAEEAISRTINVLCKAGCVDHAATRLPRPGSTLLPSNSRRLRAFSYSALCRLAFQIPGATMASVDFCPITSRPAMPQCVLQKTSGKIRRRSPGFRCGPQSGSRNPPRSHSEPTRTRT